MLVKVRKYYVHILLIIFGSILYFMANFQRVAIPGAIFDTLQSDLNIKAPSVTAFGAVFMYAYAISLLVIGLMVDKFSGVRVILFGALLFTLGSLLFANTNNLFLFYFSRTLLGLGAATFYLSLIQEIKKCFPDRYFGIAISLMLFTGYCGGIFANAPFVYLSHQYGWKNVLNVLAIIILIVTVTYSIIQSLLGHISQNQKVKFCIKPFKQVLQNEKNRHLFAFGGLNYGLYYVIQTVIGVKFLQDFVNLSKHKSAMILSIMVIVAAMSGIVMAYLSKLLNNRRTIFMKAVSIFTSCIFLIISICLIFDIKTKFIAFLFILIAISGGMSPLLVPIIHAINPYEVRSTALSIMNCCFFFMVAILGTVIGFMLEAFKPLKTIASGIIVYGNNSYLSVFIMFFFISSFVIFNVFKIDDVKR